MTGLPHNIEKPAYLPLDLAARRAQVEPDALKARCEDPLDLSCHGAAIEDLFFVTVETVDRMVAKAKP